MHSHVPFVVILLQALKKWKGEHDGSSPSSFNDKKEFKDKCIKGMAKDYSKELNFSEAIKNAYLLFQEVTISESLQQIFESPNIDDKKEKDKFWLLCSALKRFYNENGKTLPVSGVVQDMTSTTNFYLKLQDVY